jgi:hypothetical protein
MNLKPQPHTSAETQVKPKPAGVMEITLSLLPPKSRSSDKSCFTMRAHRRFDSKVPSVISRGCFPQTVGGKTFPLARVPLLSFEMFLKMVARERLFPVPQRRNKIDWTWKGRR